VFVTTTNHGHIQITEVLSPMTETITENLEPKKIGNISKYIEQGTMLGCVDASLKGTFYGRYVYFSDTTNKTIFRFSIGVNNWNGTIFMAKARALYEAFKMMLRFHIDHLSRHTDNKQLKLVMNKKNPTHTYLSQEAGAIIAEMIEI